MATQDELVDVLRRLRDPDAVIAQARNVLQAHAAEVAQDARALSDGWQTIRAALLRLASVDAELATARETIKRLNRRAQVAEAGVAEKVKASGGGFGRSLANAAAAMFMRERDEALAELAALKSKAATTTFEALPSDDPRRQVEGRDHLGPGITER